MAQEIKIEKKASEVLQPGTQEEALQAIRNHLDLSGADLHEMDLHNLKAAWAILRKTNLSGADMSRSLLVNPNFFRARLHTAAIHNTTFLKGDLVEADFKGADLSDSAFLGVDAQDAGFQDACLRNSGWVNANLQNADLNHADLTNARLTRVNVSGADFTGADMTGVRAFHVDWSMAKVPPAELPESLVKFPILAWSVLAGGMLGTLAVVIYALTHKGKPNSPMSTS